MDTPIIGRGIHSNGTLVAHYYTTEPSPGKYVAVGTIMFWPMPQNGRFPHWMLVGTGRTEKLAVAHLRERMREMNPPRWRIKCESAPASTGEEAPNDTSEESGGYVVPWEIERSNGENSMGLKVPEAAAR